MGTNLTSMLISDVCNLLMQKWRHSSMEFINLRKSYGTYVFDAVMAVLLGGTGSKTQIQKQYISIVFNSKDVNAWKANAGLRPNIVKNTNYNQRGFFNYPIVNNNMIKKIFTDTISIGEVCKMINNFPDDYFRINRQNMNIPPRQRFIDTIYEILKFAMHDEKEDISLKLINNNVPELPISDPSYNIGNASDADVSEIESTWGTPFGNSETSQYNAEVIVDFSIKDDENPDEYDYISECPFGNENKEYISNIPKKENIVGKDCKIELINELYIEEDMIIYRKTGKTIPDVRVDVLNLSRRPYNCLRRAKIQLLSQLIGAFPLEEQKIRNLGIQSINEIYEKLDLYIQNYFDKSMLQSEEVDTSEDAVYVNAYEYLIEATDLSVRAKKCLKKNGIMDIYQLLQTDTSTLMNLPNLGQKTFSEILEFKKYVCESDRYDIPQELKHQNDPTQTTEKTNSIISNNFSIDATDLSVRAKNCLRRNGIMNIYQLVNTDESTIMQFSNLGKKTLSDILEFKKHICVAELKYQMESSQVMDRILDLIRENDITGITLEQLKNQLLSDYSEEIIEKAFEQLIHDSKIEQAENEHYVMKTISCYDAMKKYLSEREFEVLEKRIDESTLISIAYELKLSRERVRQIQEKALKKLKLQPQIDDVQIRELRFQKLYKKYDLNQSEFCTVTHEKRMSYQLLKIMFDSGKEPINKILEDEAIPEWIKENVNSYIKDSLNYIILAEDKNRHIPKNRSGIMDYVLERYCQDNVTIEEFFNIYNQFVTEHNLKDEVKLLDEKDRNIENLLSSHNSVLRKHGRKLRYYNIAAREYTELLQALNLARYENIELSTEKFMNDYPEIMQQYDIRNKYELHSLLRKIGAEKENESLKFGIMPHIRFGTFDRENMVRELMFELAPINADDLADIIHTEYGFTTELTKTWFNCIDEYYSNGIYSVHYEEMPEHDMKILLCNLNDDFYYISEIKKIYQKIIPDGDASLISSFNLKRMGFIVNSTYAVRNFNSASNYFVHLLTEQDIIDTTEYSRRFTGLVVYSAVLEKLRDNYEIIEFEPNQYINIRRLQQMGISTSDLKNYCNDIDAFTDDNTYFTIKIIRNSGFSSKLDSLGFDEWFYSSLLRQDLRFSYVKCGGNVIFYKGKSSISRQSFLIDFITKLGSIELDKLLEQIKCEYGIIIDSDDAKRCFHNTELYYDDIMEKVYKDYDTYFDEINAVEEDDEYEDYFDYDEED